MIYTENSPNNTPPWVGWDVGTVGSGTVYYTAGGTDAGWTPGLGMAYCDPQFTAPIVPTGVYIPRATIIAAFTPKGGSCALKAATPYFCPATDIRGQAHSALTCDAGAIQVTP